MEIWNYRDMTFNKLNLWNNKKIEDREMRFLSYSNRGPYQKNLFSKLRGNEIRIIEEFLIKNKHLSREDFEMTLNRYFLYKDRPKNWTIRLTIDSPYPRPGI